MLTLVHPARRTEIYCADENEMEVTPDTFWQDTHDSVHYCDDGRWRNMTHGADMTGTSYVSGPEFTGGNNYIDNKPFSVRWTFVNKSSTEVTLIDRNGIPLKVPVHERRGYSDNTLFIYKQIFFHSGVELNAVIEDMKKTKAVMSREYVKTAEVFSQPQSNNRWTSVVKFAYQIPLEKIESCNGLIYHQNTDYLISSRGVQSDTIHPYAPENIRQPNMPDNYNTSVNDLTTCFRYVSNNPDDPPKFVNVGGMLLKLQPQIGHPQRDVYNAAKDTYTQADRYIEIMFPENGLPKSRSNSSGMKLRRILVSSDPKDQKELAIFDTLEEALDSKTEYDKNKSKLMKKLEDAEHDATKVKRLHDDKVAQLEKEIRDKNEEIQVLKKRNHVEEEQLKSARERESHEKKQSSETSKGIMGMITSFLALIPLLFKIFTLAA